VSVVADHHLKSLRWIVLIILGCALAHLFYSTDVVLIASINSCLQDLAVGRRLGRAT
jgi:hypothetical protein